jgi:hypothetical protein
VCAICISSGDTEAVGVLWSETIEGSDMMLYEVFVEAKEFLSYLDGMEKTLDVREVRADEAIEAIEAIDGREAWPGTCSELFWRGCAEKRLISGKAVELGQVHAVSRKEGKVTYRLGDQSSTICRYRERHTSAGHC